MAKYGDHLPLHRQSVIYARGGVELERSTLADLKACVTAALASTGRKSALAGTIGSSLPRRPALRRFVRDGRPEMRNNTAERAIRPLALGRKNYLFAGSRRAAILYPLIQTATVAGLDP